MLNLTGLVVIIFMQLSLCDFTSEKLHACNVLKFFLACPCDFRFALSEMVEGNYLMNNCLLSYLEEPAILDPEVN
jgi:hypothetical protein